MKALTQESLDILRRVWEKAAQVEAFAKEKGLHTIVAANFATDEWAYFGFFLQTEDKRDIAKVSDTLKPETEKTVMEGLDFIASLCEKEGKALRIMALEAELKELKGE